jgi:hypothetical protein
VKSCRLLNEDGAALVIALLSLMLMMALAMSLALTTITETRIAASYREGTEAFYAADGAIERVMPDLRAAASTWNDILAGTIKSTFIDGPGADVRRLPDGTLLNLTEAPWGENAPRWQLYAHGPIASFLPPGRIDSRLYIVVWVADDSSEKEAITVLAQAYGARGVSRAVEVTVEQGGGGVRLRSWREVR